MINEDDTDGEFSYEYDDEEVYRNRRAGILSIPIALRKAYIPAERKALIFLESIGFKKHDDFFYQYPVLDLYILDFAFVEKKICIEIDGKGHKTKLLRQKDVVRDTFLRANGWKVVRIRNEELDDKESLRFYKNLIWMLVEESNDDLSHDSYV